MACWLLGACHWKDSVVCSLLFFSWPWDEEFCSTTPSSYDMLSWDRAKSKDQLTKNWENREPKQTTVLCKLCISYICYSAEKLINITFYFKRGVIIVYCCDCFTYFQIYLLFNYVYMCVYLHVGICMSLGSHESRSEALHPFAAGVMGDCELSNMSSRKQIQVSKGELCTLNTQV